MNRFLVLLLGLVLFASPAESFRFHHGGLQGAVVASCPKGANQVDYLGFPDECADAPPNGVYQNANWFGTGTGNARQSGQSVYALNDSNIPWNIPGVDNKTGYNTDKVTFDPIHESFIAQNSSITSGVLLVSSANLGVIFPQQGAGKTFYLNGVNAGMAGGTPFVGQILNTGTSPRITSQIDATHWQTDQPALNVASTTITGQMHPQLGCLYWSLDTGISSVPVVDCYTTSDTTTASLFDGYDGEIEGIWLRIHQGEGGGNTGVAGPVTITNSRFKAPAAACNISNLQFGTGLHFDLHIKYNRFDGNWPTCTLTTAMNSNVVGTPGQYQVLEIKWNHMQNMPSQPMQNRGNYTSIEIANNTMPTYCMERTVCKSVGGIHGALFANSQQQNMTSYIYARNQLIAPKEVGASSITVPLSFLADATTGYANATIDYVRVNANITTVNCQDGVCAGAGQTARSALWSANDTTLYTNLISGSNLADATGATSGYFFGGNARNKATGTIQGYGTGFAIVNITNINGENYSVNTHLHVNSTPFTMTGSIAPSGLHDGLGLLTLSAPNASLTTDAVAGIKVPPGICIQSKTDTSHFIVHNFYGTSDALLTAPLQAMYTAFSVLDPSLVTDPATGNHPTGTGTNNGTYAVQSCGAAGGPTNFTTWNRFNPTIGVYPPQVNDGTDKDLVTGGSIYMGGQNWSTGVTP